MMNFEPTLTTFENIEIQRQMCLDGEYDKVFAQRKFSISQLEQYGVEIFDFAKSLCEARGEYGNGPALYDYSRIMKACSRVFVNERTAQIYREAAPVVQKKILSHAWEFDYATLREFYEALDTLKPKDIIVGYATRTMIEDLEFFNTDKDVGSKDFILKVWEFCEFQLKNDPAVSLIYMLRDATDEATILEVMQKCLDAKVQLPEGALMDLTLNWNEYKVYPFEWIIATQQETKR